MDEHEIHAKMHEARLVNPALVGRLPLDHQHIKTNEEAALQAEIYAMTAELEKLMMRLPENEARVRAIQTLEHIIMWVEHTLNYSPVILPEQP